MPTTIVKPRRIQDGQGAHRKNTPKTSYFTHIDGLRGFAIFLVVFFHVFVGRVSSGVDVFLFIGGLLFVSSQTKNALNPDGLTFTQSTIRIFRRLYPSLIVAVSAATVASLAVFPNSEWKQNLEHASASLLYMVNYVFIEQGDDYVRAGDGADAFQHLWSMSAQMQIYMALLVVISIVCALGKNKPKVAKNVVSCAVIILTALSFLYATQMNSVDQEANYYSTLSRFWEIGLGSLVGIFLLQQVVLAPALRWILSIVGITMIVGTGLFLNGVEQFPGPWTLVPLVGAMLVILSGKMYDTEPKTLAQQGIVVWFLQTKIMTFLGKVSYNWYLWHWIILIIASELTGKEYADPILGIPVMISSLGVAWVAHTFLEVPLRQKNKPIRAKFYQIFSSDYISRAWRRRPVAAYPISGALLSIVLAFVAASPYAYEAYANMEQRKLDRFVESLGGYEKVYPGAMQNIAGVIPPDDMPILPNTDDLDSMLPQTQVDKCFTNFKSTDIVHNKDNGRPCEYGDVRSKETLYLVGGSHSEMFLPALDKIGQDRGFKIVPLIKMGCALYTDKKWNGSDYPECIEWSDKVVKYILDNPPTVGIFNTSTRPTDILGNGQDIVPAGYIDSAQKFDDAGITQYLVRDVPWMMIDQGRQKDIRVCVSDRIAEGGKPSDCGQKAPQSLAPVYPAIAAYGGMKHVKLMDVNGGFITPDEWIQPVMGNVLVYRDSHHITNRFAETLKPMLEDQMFNRPILPAKEKPVATQETRPAPAAPEGVPQGSL